MPFVVGRKFWCGCECCIINDATFHCRRIYRLQLHILPQIINWMISSKVILVGQSNVGKSTIVSRLRGDPAHVPASTVGCAFGRIVLEHDPKIILDVWDTAGQERYKSLCPMYFRQSNIILCVFDVTKQESIDQLGDYIKMIPDVGATQFIFIGNKIDLDPSYDAKDISRHVFSKLINTYQLAHASTVLYMSALTLDGMDTLKTAMASTAMKAINTVPVVSVIVPPELPAKTCCGFW